MTVSMYFNNHAQHALLRVEVAENCSACVIDSPSGVTVKLLQWQAAAELMWWRHWSHRDQKQ